MLIICGRTYTTRLWCCLELYVYFHVSAGDKPGQTIAPKILMLGEGKHQVAENISRMEHFHASRCKCYDENDKNRIFHVIENLPGGVQFFDEHIREVAMSLWPEFQRRAERSENFNGEFAVTMSRPQLLRANSQPFSYLHRSVQSCRLGAFKQKNISAQDSPLRLGSNSRLDSRLALEAKLARKRRRVGKPRMSSN